MTHLRRSPIEQRKAKLAKLVRGPHPGIVLNGITKANRLRARLQAWLRGHRVEAARLALSLRAQDWGSAHWIKAKHAER